MVQLLSPQEKLELIAALEQKERMQSGLPHLYGMPWYSWAKRFFDSRDRYNFLCAANQISKSSTQIRKVIHWATATDLWPKLWPRRPTQFWYLYPNKSTATVEVMKKWIDEFLPKGEFKDHPQYGWRLEIKNKEVYAIHFNTGVSVYFKTYAQDVHDLQSGSVHYIAFDEELPEDLWDELNLRIAATDGYLSGVFTATRGQEFWREVIEERGKNERLKDALKQQISMYDCLFYIDGTPSHWSVEKITRIKNSLKSEAEVLRRVYGRFIVDSGLKYPGFSRIRNIEPVGKLWPASLIFVGIDIGGGGDGHPAAICFIAVRPDCKKARVFRGWRGDGELTTAADILNKYIELKRGLNITAAYFDWAAKDFGTIANRMGITIMPAEKSHERGESALNVMFKNEILTIDDIEELKPLAQEFTTLQITTDKRKAKDDFIDACRYAAVALPIDWSVISSEIDLSPLKPVVNEMDLARRGRPMPGEVETICLGVEEELSSWGELYEF